MQLIQSIVCYTNNIIKAIESTVLSTVDSCGGVATVFYKHTNTTLVYVMYA